MQTTWFEMVWVSISEWAQVRTHFATPARETRAARKHLIIALLRGQTDNIGSQSPVIISLAGVP